MCTRNDFKCKHCGSTNFVYEKYVRCKTPVHIQEDGTIVYLPSIIDEDDSIPACYGFCCADCKKAVLFKADFLKTEDDLKYYLSLSEEERERIDQEYLDMEFAYADYMEECLHQCEERISDKL